MSNEFKAMISAVIYFAILMLAGTLVGADKDSLTLACLFATNMFFTIVYVKLTNGKPTATQ